jgi:hypothetical protein
LETFTSEGVERRRNSIASHRGHADRYKHDNRRCSETQNAQGNTVRGASAETRGHRRPRACRDNFSERSVDIYDDVAVGNRVEYRKSLTDEPGISSDRSHQAGAFVAGIEMPFECGVGMVQVNPEHRGICTFGHPFISS